MSSLRFIIVIEDKSGPGFRNQRSARPMSFKYRIIWTVHAQGVK